MNWFVVNLSMSSLLNDMLFVVVKDRIYSRGVEFISSNGRFSFVLVIVIDLFSKCVFSFVFL